MVAETQAVESVLESLRRLKLVSEETTELFATGTRDIKDLKVFRDRASGVIYLEDDRTHTTVYRKGEYRQQVSALIPDRSQDYEDVADTGRRLERFRPFIVGKRICDFGCGAGSFLRGVQKSAQYHIGVELQDDYREVLNRDGLRCVDRLDDVPAELDTVFLFHSLEHLRTPRDILRMLREKMKSKGQSHLVVEVPHARDFLIDHLELREFIDFTLWSQHLVLYTRQSLNALLRDAGFSSVVVEGVQRYGLANHLHWLKCRKPGGHKQALALIETDELSAAYAAALGRVDANDTLVAIATT